jgi:hypothetical protein
MKSISSCLLHYCSLLLAGSASLGLLTSGLGLASSVQRASQPYAAIQEYRIEYRVTGTGPAADYLAYTNASGGTTLLQHTKLPAHFTFLRSLKLGQYANILATLDHASDSSAISAQILLDGQVVKQQTGTGPAAEINLVYVLGE